MCCKQEKVEKLEQLLAKVLSSKQTEEIKLEATPATNNGTVVTENDVVATDETPYDAGDRTLLFFILFYRLVVINDARSVKKFSAVLGATHGI